MSVSNSVLEDISMDNQPYLPTVTPLRKGLAIAALVIGIVSILTCGGLLIGPITGITLGVVALNKIKRDSAHYAGKGLAIAGIVTSACSLFIVFPVIIAAIAIPNLLKSQQAAHEAAALTELQTIAKQQVLYSITRGKGKFADLATLGSLGYVDSELATGTKGGYVFASTPINAEGMPAMFDATAHPSEIGNFGTGNYSYYSNETMVIYETEGIKPPTATPRDRVPKDGSPTE
jgi:competence protein ComGC